MPAIRRPFPGISQHAHQAEGVGRETVDRRQQLVVPARAAAIAIGVALADLIAPPARCVGAGAGGIFPFRFAGQAIGIAVSSPGRAARAWC